MEGFELNRLKKFWRTHKAIIIISLSFGVIYALISLVNHYNFRTYALDLGLYTNALYDYTHFQWNDSSVFKEVEENLLADHFDFYLILFSPLSLLFGTYTLLIVQILALLWGGAGVYTYFNEVKSDRNTALFASVYYFLFFGIYSALSFDYHSNVVAATLVPWFFYFVGIGKMFRAALVLLLIIVGKENMPLWTMFLALGLAIEYRKNSYKRNFLLVLALLSAVSFVLIISVFMPWLSVTGSYHLFYYSFLGNNFKEAIIHLLTHPFESLKVLFVNHTGDPLGDYVKLESILALVFSGFLFLIRKPHYILMLLPVIFQKFFHDNVAMWSVAKQYSIEFAPVMAIGVFDVLSEVKKERVKKALSFIVLALTLGTTIRIMDNPIIWIDKARIRFYQKEHYQRHYDVREVYNLLKQIPKDARVSVQSCFLPHIALRDKVYQFPIIKDAEYIVYSFNEGTYPMDKENFIQLVNELKNSEQWKVWRQAEKTTVLIRVGNLDK